MPATDYQTYKLKAIYLRVRSDEATEQRRLALSRAAQSLITVDGVVYCFIGAMTAPVFARLANEGRVRAAPHDWRRDPDSIVLRFVQHHYFRSPYSRTGYEVVRDPDGSLRLTWPPLTDPFIVDRLLQFSRLGLPPTYEEIRCSASSWANG